MAQIISGKETAAKIRERLRAQINQLREKGYQPGLAVVIVGDDPASQVYVRNKEKACKEVGIAAQTFALPKETTQQELMALIDTLNARSDIHGILVQLPLPRHLDEHQVINAILPEKDVDAFHPVNVGKIMIGDFDYVPCTPAGVMALLEEAQIDVSGKRAVVIGRSNIVGKPQAMLLLHKNATVTICHSKTQHLEEITRQADIIVVAIGKAHFLRGDMVKDGVVVIDVGMNRLENGKLAGDVDFDTVAPKASYITPVPGGVGPMTITMLLQNTVTACRRANNLI
ncbi:MAG: bifunctional methylenetetrahydrofolate dehydrogenase/methenyltetrahydrofolate cyclohydrolase FolD [Clostridiales bacterium]|nr:bifunctional methylenetetrahydrofolate dehydrogenase/methenyltetrahydrofolate cyclohydrolase FolD [Clostridiales bacterium]